MQPERAARFHRQLILPELGPRGQAALTSSRVLVVGCGGLGAPVIQYLAAAGVGHLTLMDDDVVETSNLNRQVVHRERDVGRPKVERAAEWVRELDAALDVKALHERLSTDNARERLRGFDLVVDCTDGLPVKYLINDAAVREGVPLVHGAVTALAGQVMVVPRGGKPCLRCLFEEIPGDMPTCQTAGVLGAVVGVVGAMMANEAVKLLATEVTTLSARFLAYDGAVPQMRILAVPGNAACRACGDAPTVDARTAADYTPVCA